MEDNKIMEDVNFVEQLKQTYIITIGDYEQGGIVYKNRCLSASYGCKGVASEVIPWEGTNNNPWDYKYEDNTFVLDVLPTPTPIEPTPSAEEVRFTEIEDALIEVSEMVVENETDTTALAVQIAEIQDALVELAEMITGE